MSTTISIPQRPERKFLPQDFSATSWQALEPYFKDIAERPINSYDDLKQMLSDYSEASTVVGEEIRWRYVKVSVDTTDEAARNMLQDYYINIEPQLKVVENQINQKINHTPFKEELKNDSDFLNFIKGLEIDLRLFNEKNIPIQQEISIKENEYAMISGQWVIEQEGQKYTFQQANKFLKDQDRKLREEVFRKMLERRLQDVEALDNLYTLLVEKRDEVARNAGYANYRDYAFDAKHRFDYTAEDCRNFQNSVAEAVVPVLASISAKRKAQMKLDVLKPWDTQVDPLGRAPLKPFETTQEFVDKTIACFNQLDTYFGERIAIMNEMNYLDLESRPGKAPGGYNMTMPEIGVPFIFMNHASSEGDVRVMVHEGGHAIHTFLAHPLKYDFFKSYPSEVAELASMSMELFSLEHWDVFYENETDLKRAKENHLIGLLHTLPGVGKGDEFQHWVYTNPKHTPEQRKQKWTELSDKFGDPEIDVSDLKEDVASGYQKILHFYQVPFYYIEYGFAQLGAIAMWKNFKKNPQKTIDQYKAALSLGYTRSIPEIYEAAGIRFDFSKEYVQELVTFVKEEIDKLGA
jgi:oligoendopeptidase F